MLYRHGNHPCALYLYIIYFLKLIISCPLIYCRRTAPAPGVGFVRLLYAYYYYHYILIIVIRPRLQLEYTFTVILLYIIFVCPSTHKYRYRFSIRSQDSEHIDAYIGDRDVYYTSIVYLNKKKKKIVVVQFQVSK